MLCNGCLKLLCSKKLKLCTCPKILYPLTKPLAIGLLFYVCQLELWKYRGWTVSWWMRMMVIYLHFDGMWLLTCCGAKITCFVCLFICLFTLLAAQFIKQKLPDLLRSYIDADVSGNQEGGFQDIAIEVLHLLLSHLLFGQKGAFGVGQEQIDAFLKTLRRGKKTVCSL